MYTDLTQLIFNTYERENTFQQGIEPRGGLPEAPGAEYWGWPDRTTISIRLTCWPGCGAPGCAPSGRLPWLYTGCI